MYPVSQGEISVTPLRASKVLTIIAFSNDYSYKRNYSVSDVTRNLRNLRPTFELREQWQYTDQVLVLCSSALVVAQGGTFNIDVHDWCERCVNAVWHALRGFCELPYI